MSLVVFDVELTGPSENALNMVLVHHDSFEKTSFPLTHILNVAINELGWSQTWIELKCQQTGNVLVLLQYHKCDKGYWNCICFNGQIPEVNKRVDLYLLDHKPNRVLDMFVDA